MPTRTDPPADLEAAVATQATAITTAVMEITRRVSPAPVFQQARTLVEMQKCFAKLERLADLLPET